MDKTEVFEKGWGKYKIDKKLGEGGVGQVYKAFDTTLDRVVAIKTLKLSSEGAIQRFLHEAKATAKLEHPNIVPIYTIEKMENQYCLVMKFIEGVSLEKVIKEKKISVTFCCKTMIKILEGMQYAHDQGFIHRDIKPANILIDNNGEPYITDFGLVKCIQEDTPQLTQTGAIMGTPCYMSPEQAKGAAADHRSDIYSLGAMFYEMLLKKRAFDGESALEILYKVLNEVPVIPSETKHISPSLINVFLKAMEKDQKKRYQSASEMAKSIQRAMTSQTKKSHKKTPTSKKNNVQAYAIITLAVTCITLFAMIFSQKHDPQIDDLGEETLLADNSVNESEKNEQIKSQETDKNVDIEEDKQLQKDDVDDTEEDKQLQKDDVDVDIEEDKQSQKDISELEPVKVVAFKLFELMGNHDIDGVKSLLAPKFVPELFSNPRALIWEGLTFGFFFDFVHDRFTSKEMVFTWENSQKNLVKLAVGPTTFDQIYFSKINDTWMCSGDVISFLIHSVTNLQVNIDNYSKVKYVFGDIVEKGKKNKFLYKDPIFHSKVESSIGYQSIIAEIGYFSLTDIVEDKQKMISKKYFISQDKQTFIIYYDFTKAKGLFIKKEFLKELDARKHVYMVLKKEDNVWKLYGIRKIF